MQDMHNLASCVKVSKLEAEPWQLDGFSVKGPGLGIAADKLEGIEFGDGAVPPCCQTKVCLKINLQVS